MSVRKSLSLVDHDRLHDTRVELIKLPPHSVEAEQSVLGALLLDNKAWDSIADLVSAADFYRGDHRLIWSAVASLIDERKVADVITVAEHLEQLGKLDDVGGLAYLGAVAQNTPSAANVRTYAGIVRDKSILRRLAIAGGEVADLAYHPNGRQATDILNDAQARIMAVTESAEGSDGFVEMRPIVSNVVDTVDMLYNRHNPDDILGVPTGFSDLDRMLSGLNPGDLVVLAARPSMGKTALAMNIAAHVGIVTKLPVGIFSMEMPKEQLALRIMCSQVGINFHLVRKGRLHDESWKLLTDAVRLTSDSLIEIDETGAITPTELAARSRRLCRKYGKLGLLVIDYIQLMGVDGLGDTRAGEIGVATRGLKKLAKELNVPVLALSQVNRGVESRPNKRPNMSDLRESGDIEQDADVVMFLYRDEVYNDTSPDKGTAEVIVAKQRNGPIGKVTLVWQGEFMRFMNFADPGRY